MLEKCFLKEYRKALIMGKNRIVSEQGWIETLQIGKYYSMHDINEANILTIEILYDFNIELLKKGISNYYRNAL